MRTAALSKDENLINYPRLAHCVVASMNGTNEGTFVLGVRFVSGSGEPAIIAGLGTPGKD